MRISKALMITVCLMILTAPIFGGGQTESADDSVPLEFQSWLATEEASRAVIQEMVNRFQEANPGTEVDLLDVPYGETLEQTIVSASAGNPPDVIQLVPTFASPLAAIGSLRDLSPYFDEQQLDGIPRAALESGIVEGRLISVPWQIAPIAVFGNRELMRQAGLPEEIPGTLEEFKHAIREISALDDRTYGFGARTDRSANAALWFAPWIWLHGGGIVDSDGEIAIGDSGTVAAFEWLGEMGSESLTPIGMAVPEARSLFAEGRIGFVFEGPWMRGIMRDMTGLGTEADDLYVVGEMPVAPDGNRYTHANHHVLAVAEQTQYPDQAAALIDYLTSNQEIATYYYEQMAAIPVYRSILQEPLFADDPFVQVFVESAEYAQALLSTNPSLSEALDFMAADMQAVLLGGDAADAAQSVRSSFETLFDD